MEKSQAYYLGVALVGPDPSAPPSPLWREYLERKWAADEKTRLKAARAQAKRDAKRAEREARRHWVKIVRPIMLEARRREAMRAMAQRDWQTFEEGM